MRSDLKVLFSGRDDLQKMRIQAGNRIVANFKLRTGQATGTPESKLDKEGQEILARIRKAYKRMADAASDLPRISKFKGTEVISTYAELILADAYEKFILQEKRYDEKIKPLIHKEQLWKQYLKGVPGVGEAMALVIMALIDITKAKYPSSIWKYAGLDVAQDGTARSRKEEHLVMKEYKDKNGELKKKKGITYNPKLKSKLLGVLGPSFIKAGIRKKEGTGETYAITKYGQIYLDYRNRLENHPKYRNEGTAPTTSKNGKKLPSPKRHRHDMAIRYVVKIFIIDLYTAWRKLENLPVSQPYHEAKLNIKHREDHVD